MKTYRYLLLLMAIAVCLNSCKKSSTTGGGLKPPTTKLKYLVQATVVTTGPAILGSPVTTSFTYYTYDSKKRLNTVKNGNDLTTYAYQDDGNIYSITDVNTVDKYRTSEIFSYDGGKLKSYTSQEYSNDVLKNETTYTYVYNGDKVSELHFDIYYLLYTYDSNGNLTKIFNHSGDINYSLVYTYDNKKSAFINVPVKFPMHGDNSRFSPNNQITSTTEGLNVNVLSTTTYNYDSDGYPIAGTTSNDYASSSSSKFTYTYSTLE